MKNVGNLFRAFMLAALLCISVEIPCLAGEADTESMSENGTASMTISATIPSTFTVSIPKTISLSAETKTATYAILADCDLSGKQKVCVTPLSSFLMKQAGKNDVTATVTQEKSIFRDNGYTGTLLDTEVRVDPDSDTDIITGTISAEGLTAGTWNGTLTFTIALDSDE